MLLLARSSILSSDVLARTFARPRVQLLVRNARHSRTDHSLLPTPPPLSNLATSKDAAEAREWLMRFRGCPIPRAAVDIAFSRSPGPGGQNVNKVNTKATVRCALDSTWIPSWARDGLRESAQNVDDCLSKLHALICSTASRPIKNDPSEEQRERVRGLERRADAQRRLQKDKRGQTKRQRANHKLDWE